MTDQRTAPFYPVPPRRVISIEHPAIIHNVDKAIDTLQGNTGISRVLNPSKTDTPANLVLRPDDAMSRPLQSISSPSNNVLLKVTVPRRTGRRRKRGSNGPFTGTKGSSSDGGTDQTARDLQRSLADNAEKYQIEPVGMVERTHVFRGMPDFVLSTSASQFTNRFRDQVLSFDYEKMKHFDISMDKGAITNVDIIPPPSFSHGDIPFTYLYRQNPTVKQSIDTTGQIRTINTSQSAKVLTHLVPFDIPVVPHQPRESCPPIHTLELAMQETIQVLETLFTARPAWTRRGLRNSLTTLEQRHSLRHAIPYVGYIFRSGPWRDAIVKLGHDPRSSPDYRIYQTAMFRLLAREPEVARDGGGTAANNDNQAPGTSSSGGRRYHPFSRPPEVTAPAPLSTTTTTKTTSDGTISTTTPVPTSTTHIFTGHPPLARDGKMWMFCDITDPLLRSLLFPESTPASAAAPVPAQAPGQSQPFLRQTCEPVADGWYQTATLAKAKTIMRSKIQSLAEEREPDDNLFARIIALFPDHIDETNLQEDFVRKFSVDDGVGAAGEATSKEMQLATDIRATIRAAVSWRGMIGRAAGPQDTGQDKGNGKQVRWEDDESEGEEEERERVEDEDEGVGEGEDDMDTAEQ